MEEDTRVVVRFARRWRRDVVVLVCSVLGLPAFAQVELDGTLPNGRTDSLPGPAYAITADMGEQLGGNLFHSFRVFNLAAGESALFSGPIPPGSAPVIERVIARVTGEPSTIAGRIATSQESLGDADLFLLNPHGIVFEDGSSLDVGGSFVASTAHNLQLEGGGVYDAVDPGSSLLTSAAPSAFGFLDPGVVPIEPIRVSGRSTRLNVAPGATLALVGGDVEVTGGAILGATAGFDPIPVDPGIDVALVAAAGEGVVAIDPDAPTLGLDVDGMPALGDVTIGPGARVSTTGSPSGALWIRGERIVMDAGRIDATNLGGDGAALDLAARGDIEISDLSCSSNCGGSSILSLSLGSGRGADLRIEAENMRVTKGSRIDLWTRPSGLGPGGRGGDLHVELGDGTLELSSAAKISTESFSAARSGDATFRAGTIRVSGQGAGSSPTEIRTSGVGSLGSVGGDLLFEASESMEVVDGGRLFTHAGNQGVGGSIVIDAGHFELARANDNNNSVILSDTTGALAPGLDTGGDIDITADSFHIGAGGFITSNVDIGTIGLGGSIGVDVAGELVIESDPDGPLGGIQALVCGVGVVCDGSEVTRGGDVTIEANRMRITGGVIDSSSFGGGPSGNIVVTVEEGLTLDAGGSIRSTAQGRFDAGNIRVDAGDSDVSISGWSFSPDWINPAFPDGNPQPGGILIQAQTAGGSSGDALITAGSVVLSEGGQIISNTFGPGDGGDIEIRADRVEISGFNARARQELADLGIEQNARASSSALRADSERAFLGSAATGDAGDITIRDFSLLRLADEASILAESNTPGDAGTIRFEGDHVQILGASPETGPRIEASKLGPDPAGEPGGISIVARESFESGNAIVATRGRVVEGGAIRIEARDIDLGPGSLISARSDGAGDAGSIEVFAGRQLTANGAEVSTLADVADGGNIQVRGGELAFLRDSELTAQVLEGNGEGGNVTLEADAVALDASRIVANAVDGPGGNIQINARIFVAQDSTLDASSETGIDGVVIINSPVTNVVNALTPLPERYLEAADRVEDVCAARRSGVGGSFVVSGREALPLDPDSPLPAASHLGTNELEAASEAFMREPRAAALWTIDCASESDAVGSGW
jgi:filamentous hemagglutinin family protein